MRDDARVIRSAAPNRRACLVALLATGLAAGRAAAAGFPTRPLTLVVPFAPGGIADLTARAVADAMAADLGQPVVVDNRPGAGAIAASTAVARAAADGHTLLLVTNGHAVSRSLFRQLPYDAARDFAPISLLGQFDLGLFVAAEARWPTLAAWLAEARARPGRLSVGSIAVGSTQHLSAAWLQAHADVDVLRVPYTGTPALLAALRGGEVDLAVEIVAPMRPQLDAGTVRALALTGPARLALLPAVPTADEAGLPGFVVASWNALAAPAGTPPAVIARLQAAVAAALAAPALRQRLEPLGMRLQASTPAELADWLGRETERWGGVVRRAGIEPR